MKYSHQVVQTQPESVYSCHRTTVLRRLLQHASHAGEAGEQAKSKTGDVVLADAAISAPGSSKPQALGFATNMHEAAGVHHITPLPSTALSPDRMKADKMLRASAHEVNMLQHSDVDVDAVDHPLGHAADIAVPMSSAKLAATRSALIKIQQERPWQRAAEGRELHTHRVHVPGCAEQLNHADEEETRGWAQASTHTR